jgi:hypothetical protein
MSDKISEVFDITPMAYQTIETNSVIAQSEAEEAAEDSDFKYTRQNQIDLIEASKAAVQTAIKIATESEQPRAIETLAMMLKTASEMNRQLVLQSKDRAETKKAKKDGGVAAIAQNGGTVNNNTIVMQGTMQEMLDAMKKLRNAG